MLKSTHVFASHSNIIESIESEVIKRDLVRLTIINLFFLAGVLAVYFLNEKNKFLEQWFFRLFGF